MDASNIVEVQRAGYIIKDENGKRLYCVKEQKTGSHIESTTACLTKEEWERVHEASVRGIDAMATPLPPHTEHPGGH